MQENHNETHTAHAMPEPIAPSGQRKRMGTVSAFVVAGFLGLFFLLGVWPRLHSGKAIADVQKDLRPNVVVVAAQRAKANTELTLPGTLLPIQEAMIFARTNGYVKQWKVDIGELVKPGQLLAEIETPEIDRELKQVLANQQQVKANMDLARSTAERWKAVLKENAVSPQEVDEKISAYKARQADYAASQASVERLIQLKSFQRVTAPFAGTITGRNVEIGQLISAGNADANRWMFKVAKMDTLKLYINVPQSHMRMIKVDLPVNVILKEFPKPFVGKVLRTAGALDPQSKTLLTEVNVPNEKFELAAGMYVQAKFALNQTEPNILLPANTLMVRQDGPQVAAVANNTVQLRKVKLGRDLGTQIEILSGVEEKDMIVTNPTDAMRDGVNVNMKVAEPDKPATPPAAKPEEKPTAPKSTDKPTAQAPATVAESKVK
jgi:membrane fusion protein, multidrug efflux system